MPAEEGSSSAAQEIFRFVWDRRLWVQANDTLRHFCLNLTEMLHQAFEPAVFRQHLFTDLVKFFDDRILDHSHGSMSSDGVQISGGSLQYLSGPPPSRRLSRRRPAAAAQAGRLHHSRRNAGGLLVNQNN